MKPAILALAFLVSSSAFAAEVLKGISFDEKSITITVGSGGCTGKEDFKVTVDRSTPAEVTFNRLKPDFCQAFFPDGVKLTWTREELNLHADEKFVVTNPVKSDN